MSFSVFLKSLLLAGCCALSFKAFAVTSQALWYYTVKPGDNLINIAKVHLLNPNDWRQVQQLNAVKNPYKMPTGLVLKVPLVMVKHQPASADVLVVSGDVRLQKNAQLTRLNSGEKLGIGDVISTGANSSVTIRFADGTTTQLASNTMIMLDTMSLYSGGAMVDTQLRLQQGRLETHANPKAVKGNRMQITTPSAIAAVRGTEFRISAEAHAVTQETLNGQVDFESANELVAVHQGYGTVSEDGKPPVAPVALLPAINTDSLTKYIDKLPVVFTLPVLVGAVHWSGRVSEDESRSLVKAESESLTQQLEFAALEDGQYFLSVRAKDSLGIAGYDATHVFILNAQPFSPMLVSPRMSERVREAYPTFSWRASTNADFYVLQVAGSPLFEQLIAQERVNGLQYQLTHPLNAGRVYWRVAAVSQQGQQLDQGPFSNVDEFEYLPAPPMPDTSSLNVRISQNRIHVNTIAPLAGMTYVVRLANPFNQQHEVWKGYLSDGQFECDLREFGAQQLYIQHQDAFGMMSPAALIEFDAFPQ